MSRATRACHKEECVAWACQARSHRPISQRVCKQPIMGRGAVQADRRGDSEEHDDEDAQRVANERKRKSSDDKVPLLFSLLLFLFLFQLQSCPPPPRGFPFWIADFACSSGTLRLWGKRVPFQPLPV